MQTVAYLHLYYSYSSTVEPLLNGHPWGNGLWPLNGGRNNKRAIVGTLIAGRLAEMAV